jgi:hypothetical protein
MIVGSVYMESMWIWQADHTIDSGGAAHVYSGRGILIEGGPVWLIGPGRFFSFFFFFFFFNGFPFFIQ